MKKSLLVVLALSLLLVLSGCERWQDIPPGPAEMGASLDNGGAADAESTTSTAASDVVAAADFTLPLVGGGEVTLSDLQGQPVLLTLFATWCGPCQKMLPDLQQIQEDYSGEATVLLLSADESEDVLAGFLNENGYDFETAYDPDGVIPTFYDTTSTPQVYFIDKDGNIASRVLGKMTYSECEQRLSPLL